VRIGLVELNLTVVYFSRLFPGRWIQRRDIVEQNGWPQCRKCMEGDLLPLSDFGSHGAPIHYKAWVCSNPDCGFNIKIRNGDVYQNEPIASGAAHAPRVR